MFLPTPKYCLLQYTKRVIVLIIGINALLLLELGLGQC